MVSATEADNRAAFFFPRLRAARVALCLSLVAAALTYYQPAHGYSDVIYVFISWDTRQTPNQNCHVSPDVCVLGTQTTRSFPV